MLNEYRHEKAEELESDVHDGWALLRFADGSCLYVQDHRMAEKGRKAQP